LKIASTLADEPTVISHLVYNAILKMAVKTTERDLNRRSPSQESCKKLQAGFGRAGETNLLPLAFVGERALSIPTFRLSWKEIHSFTQNDEPEVSPRKPQRYLGKPATLIWLTGLFERDLNFYLKTMEKSISLAALPAPESLVLTNYLESACSIARRRVYILSSMVLPSLSRVIVRELSTQAQIKLAFTALAVERFRREHGLLPSELRELIPQFLEVVPTDPFDGAPLRYRRLPRGYIIYSVDADGHDDGGRETPEHRKAADKGSYDITFIVEH